MVELSSRALAGVRARAESVEPEEHRPHDRPGRRDVDAEPRPYLLQPRLDSVQQARIPGLQHSASQHNLHLVFGEAEAVHRGPDEGNDLVGLPIDDLGGDGVARGRLEDEWREFAEPGPGNPSTVNFTSELDRGRAPEVLWDESFEFGLRAAAVLAAGRGGDCRQADRAPTVHRVAADLTKRGKAHLAPVRAHADAVHPGSAGDRDTPTARASRPQDGEGVVPDVDIGGPAAWLCLGGISLLL